MPYLDLEHKVRTDGEFRHAIQTFGNELTALQPKVREGNAKSIRVFNAKLLEFLKFCNFNMVFLTGYFFPRYPKDKPLLYSDYAFSFQIFALNFLGFTVIRGSRQISKSTSFAARQLMLARLIPGLSSLYICPRGEQLKTYANRLHEMERAQFDFEEDHSLRKNLKLKEYANGSKIELAYVLTTAGNVRGKSADDMVYDECIFSNAILIGIEKSDILVAFNPGDYILAFDKHDEPKFDRIKRIIAKGKRPTWRITLSNGNYLECTSNERLRTNYGWLYLSQLLSQSEAQRCPKAIAVQATIQKRRADDTRDIAGGCLNVDQSHKTHSIQHNTRRRPESLLRGESCASSGLYGNASKGCTQSGLGQGELCLFDGDFSSVRIYTLSVLLPGSESSWISEEICNSRMAGTADLGGDSLVVSGRWESHANEKQLCDSQFQHTWVSRRTGQIAGDDAYRSWNNSKGASDQKERKDLLDNVVNSRSNPAVPHEDKTVCPPIHDVQSGVLATGHNLQVLRRVNSGSNCQCKSKGTVLQETGMQETAQFGTQSSMGQQTGAAGNYQSEKQNSILSGRHGIATQVTGTTQETLGRSGIPSEMECLETGLSERQEGERIAQNVKMAEASIVSIEYVGEQEVYDVEMEKYHTLFANGFAVHNCQDFDPELEIEVEQIQSASIMPITTYAGTSLTTDTFLEKKYGESSAGVWSMLCPSGHQNIPLPEYHVMDMIQAPGICCHKCGSLLDVRAGRFLHQNKAAFDQGKYGFHVPQLIVPAVVNNPSRWLKIYERKNKGNISKFFQEILGIPTEEGEREITRSQLIAICTLCPDGDLLANQRKAINRGYQFVVSGCDWGGSDYNPMTKTKISTTVHLMLGITAMNELEIIHIQRYAGMDYDTIAGDIIHNHKRMNGYAIATDFGVGAVYNAKIREQLPAEKHMIFNYTPPAAALLAEPKSDHIFNQWGLNKTESLSMTFDALRRRAIKCFGWQYAEQFLTDCLNVYRAPGEKAGGSGASMFIYRSSASRPNDTLQALNYAHMLAKIIMGQPMINDVSVKIRIESLLAGHGEAYNLPGVISG